MLYITERMFYNINEVVKMIPEKYLNETDYRKIPREYLNPRIPKGRGMIKWQPFKTMPEQYEILNQYMEDQNKIDMPILSEEQLQDINETVKQKINTNSVSYVSYWKNGYNFSIQCYIRNINKLEETMSVTNEAGNETLKIPLPNIISVD